MGSHSCSSNRFVRAISQAHKGISLLITWMLIFNNLDVSKVLYKGGMQLGRNHPVDT
jgi:hypothetical protein